MEVQMSRPGVFDKRLFAKSRTTAVRWVKDWVPQDLLATGGKCMVLKWVREDLLTALKEKSEAAEEEAEPEPMTEVLFLCSYEGCGKTFIDAGALRKHSHIHGERQYVCHYEGCGKKFVDSSKLKRHFLIHTGERAYQCPHEGCGKAFSLDFNLRAHMKTHSQENYHICPYVDCGKRFAHDYKLQAHMKSHHEKAPGANAVKHTPPAEKVIAAKVPPPIYASSSADRPYVCPYEVCGKAYIHEYKLNLHLKKEHPRHRFGENGKLATIACHDVDESIELDTYADKYPYGCPYEGCGKAYIHEYKLKLHLKKEHPGHNPEENGKRFAAGGGHDNDEVGLTKKNNDEVGDQNVVYHGRNGHFCPYEGCGKSYIHEYKLNLHLKKEHPGHNLEEKDRRASVADHDADEANERSPYTGKNTINKNNKRGKVNPIAKVPPKIARKETTLAPTNSNLGKKQWSTNDAYEEEDSEETEDEDHENINEDGWRYQEANEDDEETEDED